MPEVKFSEPPEARLLEIVLDSDGGPVLMLEMEAPQKTSKTHIYIILYNIYIYIYIYM